MRIGPQHPAPDRETYVESLDGVRYFLHSINQFPAKTIVPANSMNFKMRISISDFASEKMLRQWSIDASRRRGNNVPQRSPQNPKRERTTYGVNHKKISIPDLWKEMWAGTGETNRRLRWRRWDRDLTSTESGSPAAPSRGRHQGRDSSTTSRRPARRPVGTRQIGENVAPAIAREHGAQPLHAGMRALLQAGEKVILLHQGAKCSPNSSAAASTPTPASAKPLATHSATATWVSSVCPPYPGKSLGFNECSCMR